MYKLIDCKEFVKYNSALEMQEEAFRQVDKGEYKGILFVLEHSPVYTIGKNGGWDNFLCSKETLEKEGIHIHETDRGGNLTFHGPGQIVAYPIFDLKELGRDVGLFVEKLEQVAINVLQDYGITGYRKQDYRGAWIDHKKIAAVGVRVRRWITTHGLSFNVEVDPKHFSRINPCGISEFDVTSLKEHRSSVSKGEVKQQLIKNFETVFKIDFT